MNQPLASNSEVALYAPDSKVVDSLKSERFSSSGPFSEMSSDLWTHLLLSASSNVAPSLEKNVLLIGDAGSGKARLASMLTDQAQKREQEDEKKVLGLDCRFVEVKDKSGDLIGRLTVWRLQGDVGTRGELLQNVANPSLVLLVVDLSRPWTVVASLEKWFAVLDGNGLGKANVVVVGTKSDLLGEDSHDGLFRAVRSFCVGHGQCASVFVSLVKGSNCSLLRELVHHKVLAAVPQMSLTEPETEDLESFFVPAGWDSAERVAVLPEASLPAQPTVVVQKRKEEEAVEAEGEQSFLLRHMKLLETLREEEQQELARTRPQQQQAQLQQSQQGPQTPVVLDAPATPLGKTTSAATGAGGEGFSTPLRTPSRAAAAAAVADGTDNAGLADFFNSLLTKDKSPHKLAKPK